MQAEGERQIGKDLDIYFPLLIDPVSVLLRRASKMDWKNKTKVLFFFILKNYFFNVSFKSISK